MHDHLGAIAIFGIVALWAALEIWSRGWNR